MDYSIRKGQRIITFTEKYMEKHKNRMTWSYEKFDSWQGFKIETSFKSRSVYYHQWHHHKQFFLSVVTNWIREYLRIHVRPLFCYFFSQRLFLNGPFLLLRWQFFLKSFCLPLQFTPQLFTLDQSLPELDTVKQELRIWEENKGENETMKHFTFIYNS